MIYFFSLNISNDYSSEQKWETLPSTPGLSRAFSVLQSQSNGKEHGLWNHWYIDGKRNMEANFNNGVLDGQFKRWFDNGYLAYERIYSNGQLIEEKYLLIQKKLNKS